MQAAIDRVMQTYGMLVNLTLEEEQATRERVANFLASVKTNDETQLAVEGIRYLRGAKPSRTRRDRSKPSKVIGDRRAVKEPSMFTKR
jgi:hypothetical protein